MTLIKCGQVNPDILVRNDNTRLLILIDSMHQFYSGKMSLHTVYTKLIITWLICLVCSSPCEKGFENDHIDISDGTHINDVIIKNNVTYTKQNYFVSKGKAYGCICTMKTCIRKCCPKHFHVAKGKCLPREIRDLNVTIHNGSDILDFEKESIHLLYGNSCPLQHSPSRVWEFYLQKDGRLYLSEEEMYFNLNLYCIEEVNGTDEIFALVCMKTEENTDVLPAGTVNYFIL